MAWNMPEGASSAQYDAYMGYDQPEPDEEADEAADYELYLGELEDERYRIWAACRDEEDIRRAQRANAVRPQFVN